MTIRVYAHQKCGIKTDRVVNDYEFCCWDKLGKWLKKYSGLNKCPKCKEDK